MATPGEAQSRAVVTSKAFERDVKRPGGLGFQSIGFLLGMIGNAIMSVSVIAIVLTDRGYQDTISLPAAIGAAIILVMVIAIFRATLETVRRAEEDCRSLLEVWMEENRMTPLRYRRTWFYPDSANHLHVVYRVIVIDREGQLRTGWAYICGRETGRLEVAVHRCSSSACTEV